MLKNFLMTGLIAGFCLQSNGLCGELQKSLNLKSATPLVLSLTDGGQRDGAPDGALLSNAPPLLLLQLTDLDVLSRTDGLLSLNDLNKDLLQRQLLLAESVLLTDGLPKLARLDEKLSGELSLESDKSLLSLNRLTLDLLERNLLQPNLLQRSRLQ